MYIGILSDIHDHRDNLLWALGSLRDRGVELIFCLGDVVSPFIASELAQCSVPTFLVFGNNDGDRAMIVKLSQAEGSCLSLAYREFSEYEIDKKKYFLSHYPELAEAAALSGKYAAAFHGHTHRMRGELLGGIPIVCPGEICALATGRVSYAIFNTKDASFEHVEKR